MHNQTINETLVTTITKAYAYVCANTDAHNSTPEERPKNVTTEAPDKSAGPVFAFYKYICILLAIIYKKHKCRNVKNSVSSTHWKLSCKKCKLNVTLCSSYNYLQELCNVIYIIFYGDL